MRILVLGGAGLIGSHVTDLLVSKGHDVIIYDNLDTQVHNGKPKYLNPRAKFILGDVRYYDILRQTILEYGIEVIIHNAASVGIGQSNYEITKFVETNTLGIANILDILVNNETKVRKLIIPSSNTCYGEGLYMCGGCDKSFHPDVRVSEGKIQCSSCKGTSVFPIKTPEETKLKCNSIYSLTKRDQEAYALHIGKMYDIPVVILRYFNVYGARQSLSNPYTGVAAIFMSRVRNGKPPIIYEDGLQTRDFISVHDVARANYLAMTISEADGQIFNVGSGKATSILRLAEIIAGDLTISPKITNKFRKGDIRHCTADITKIQHVLGWKPEVKLEDGLNEVMEWSKTVEAEDNFKQATNELKKRGLL